MAGQNRVFCFGNGDDDATYLASAGLVAADVGEADFLLARGLFCLVGAETVPLEFAPTACDDLLKNAARRGLPMIVANPDLIRPDGNASPMPGVLAHRYAQIFGGDCVLVGKPHKSIYDAAFAALAQAGIVDKSRIAAVGDSMLHDVRGGNLGGIDTLFIAGGVHADELGVPQGVHVLPTQVALDTFFARFPVDEWPTTVVPGFTMAKAISS